MCVIKSCTKCERHGIHIGMRIKACSTVEKLIYGDTDMKDINWCPLEPKTTGLAPCKHTKAELSDDQGKNGHRKPKPDVLAVIKNMVEKDARDKEFTAQHEAFRKLRTEQNKKANKKKIEQERRNKALRNPARFMNR